MSPGPRHHWHPSDAEHIRRPMTFLNPTVGYVRAETDHHRRQATDAADDTTVKARSGGSGNDEDGAEYDARSNDVAASTSAAAPHRGVYQVWRSRDNRKGRHAIAISPGSAAKQGIEHPRATDTFGATLRGIARMFLRYPVWDVSYDVAVIFTLGSVIWVINGFFVWYPLQDPSSEFPGEETMGGGVTAFIGATIFEVGSVLLMIEAVNENRTGCFGWALEQAIESGGLSLRPDPAGCSHHHPDKGSWLDRNEDDTGSSDKRAWKWWPTWYELKSHYLREIGFLACLSQLIGASVFWISGFTGLPPIFNTLSTPAANGIFWLPQVVGGTGFIVSSWLFMLEVQPKWYIPAPKILGWHIGFWNLIGALGFTLCGALGFAIENEAVAYASPLTTFIGSWAFLIGSVIQWYESMEKYPISIDNNLGETT